MNTGKTVKTVEWPGWRLRTQLKQGVNEKAPRFLNSPLVRLVLRSKAVAIAGLSANLSLVDTERGPYEELCFSAAGQLAGWPPGEAF